MLDGQQHETMDPICHVSIAQAAGGGGGGDVKVWGICSWHLEQLLKPI